MDGGEMSSRSTQLRFSHFTELGITIAARATEPHGDREPPDMIEMAISWLHPRDNYCRATGRDLTTLRLSEGHGRRMPLRVLKALLAELREFEAAPLGAAIEGRYIKALLRMPAGRVERGY